MFSYDEFFADKQVRTAKLTRLEFLRETLRMLVDRRCRITDALIEVDADIKALEKELDDFIARTQFR